MNTEPKKIGRPKCAKDKVKRKRGTGLYRKNKMKREEVKKKEKTEGGPGTGSKHKNHPSRPFVTSLFYEDDNLSYFLTSHRRNMMERDCPLGYYKSPPTDNPFKVEFF